VRLYYDPVDAFLWLTNLCESGCVFRIQATRDDNSRLTEPFIQIGKDVVKVRGEPVSFGSEKIVHHMDSFSVNEVTFFFVSSTQV